jgi:hypothetical protein
VTEVCDEEMEKVICDISERFEGRLMRWLIDNDIDEA